jgi:hypothetical protein
MCRVIAVEPERGGVLAYDTIDGIEVRAAALAPALAVVAARSEQRPVGVITRPTWSG